MALVKIGVYFKFCIFSKYILNTNSMVATLGWWRKGMDEVASLYIVLM